MNNGHHWMPAGNLTLQLKPVFRIAWMYVGPITDYGWTYNQNLARIGLDSAMGGYVTSRFHSTLGSKQPACS